MKLASDIDVKKAALKALIRSGKIAVLQPGEFLNTKNDADASQPALRKVTESVLQQIMGEMVRSDLEYHDATSHLEATRVVRERNLNKLSDELETRVAAEFEKGPRATALMHQIDEAANLGESNDAAPAAGSRRAQEHEKLVKELEAHRVATSPKIRRRLAAGDQGPLSDSKIRELEVAVEKAGRKREAFAHQLKTIQVEAVETNDDTFEAKYLNHQIESLMVLEDQVKKNLEQLKFEASQDRYRVECIDPASAPKEATNNKGLKYLAGAQLGVFLFLLGLFFIQELTASPRD